MGLLLILFANYSFSQHHVKGLVKSEAGLPAQSAVISMFQVNDSIFIKASITKEDGRFEVNNIPNGTYYLNITSLGFEDYDSEPFSVENQDVELQDIILREQTENLSEVTIKVEKPMVEVMADKTIFNVQKSLTVSGDSALEMLRKAPGVIIDNSNNIIVEGKSGVLIYIDGKPAALRGTDLVNYLQTIQATNLDTVEIITQPSSKYDAEGTAGIININFKRDKSLGFNGNISSGLTVGDFARYNNSINFNNRAKKTSVYGSYSNRIGKNTAFMDLNRTQNGNNFNAMTDSEFDFNDNNLRLGLDYFVSKKSTLGILLTGNFSNNTSFTNSRTPITPQGENNPNQILVASNLVDWNTSNLYGNFNYQLKFNTETSLNVDVDYGKYNQSRNNLQPNAYYNGDESEILSQSTNYMDTPIKIDIFTSKFDFEHPVLKGKISLGAKYSNIVTDNQFDFYNRIDGEDIINEDRTNTFNYDESILASYFNFNRKFEKVNIQFGLRMEKTFSDGQLMSLQENQNNRVKREYTDWFPSAGLTYQINQKNTLALNYSKRIQRPNYQSLNPFEFQSDELSFYKGNAFLQPQYIDNLKLSHTYNYRLTTSLSYSFIEDFSAQVTEAVGDDKNFLSPRNVANQKIINLGVTYPTRFNKWWDIFFSINAYRSIYVATDEDFLGTKQNTFSLYAQNTFKVIKGFTAELSGYYSSPSVWGGTYQTESLGFLNIAIQKKFLDDRLTARLGFNDIFFTLPWRGTTQFGDLRIVGTGGSDSRQFQFNLSYNFGRNEVKSERKRKTSIEDEKGRID